MKIGRGRAAVTGVHVRRESTVPMRNGKVRRTDVAETPMVVGFSPRQPEARRPACTAAWFAYRECWQPDVSGAFVSSFSPRCLLRERRHRGFCLARSRIGLPGTPAGIRRSVTPGGLSDLRRNRPGGLPLPYARPPSQSPQTATAEQPPRDGPRPRDSASPPTAHGCRWSVSALV